jgi:phosphoribosyl 1,2-cyclic phosphodiesterase
MVVLGSGSSGNSIAVTNGTTTALVDCGFSARETARRLRMARIDPQSVTAVLVTHEHIDHTSGIDVFCRRHAPSAIVYASAGTRRAARLDEKAAEVVCVQAGEPLRLGTLTVVGFRTSHDAAEPLGFRIEAGAEVFGIVTDTGVLTVEATEALSGCTALGIECNHDVTMLERGPYPAFLKRRILSKHGHLSNPDAADALEALASDVLTRVFALHRSRTNNTPTLAGVALEERMARIGLRIPVAVAAQDRICDSTPTHPTLLESGEG